MVLQVLLIGVTTGNSVFGLFPAVVYQPSKEKKFI